MSSELLELGATTGKLLMAALLGGMIGWERESLDRPAGFRTHVLVCVGAATYMLVSQSFFTGDPGRIAAQVATGMGFLGAGTIIRHGSIVRGLTTAATLWTVAAIGLGVGRGGDTVIVAVLATLVVFLTLTTLGRVEKTLMSKRQYRMLLLHIDRVQMDLRALQAMLVDLGVAIRSVEVLPEPERPGEQEIRLTVRIPPKLTMESVNNALLEMEGVTFLQWE